MNDQLLLPFSLNPEAIFDTFVVGDNALLYQQAKNTLHHQQFNIVYWWGGKSVGKTHLLQACCRAHQEQALSPLYLPLQQHATFSPDILQGCEQLSLICLDDVDAVAGMPDWEEAIFHAHNRCQANQVPWLLSASQPVIEAQWGLADLRTRLSAGEVYRLSSLNDEQKVQALQQHSIILGLTLPHEVALYWLHHGVRDMHQLMQELAKLNRASWQNQRRLTIPFLKTVFQWS